MAGAVHDRPDCGFFRRLKIRDPALITLDTPGNGWSGAGRGSAQAGIGRTGPCAG
jgi:hypothetical protein